VPLIHPNSAPSWSPSLDISIYDNTLRTTNRSVAKGISKQKDLREHILDGISPVACSSFLPQTTLNHSDASNIARVLYRSLAQIAAKNTTGTY
jgi:hypothetical protein